MSSMIAPNLDEPNKVYILGDRRVGKTSLVRSLFGEPFHEKISPSPIGIANAKLSLNKKDITLKELTDSEDYKVTKIFTNEIEDVIAVIVVFAIPARKTYEQAKTLIKFTLDSITNNFLQIILCGNKKDLQASSKDFVSNEEINDYIQTIPNIKYFDISCLTGENISKLRSQLQEIEISPIEDQYHEEEEEEKKEKKDKGSCRVY